MKHVTHTFEEIKKILRNNNVSLNDVKQMLSEIEQDEEN
jgi:uncharacterized protein (DUF111 family)